MFTPIKRASLFRFFVRKVFIGVLSLARHVSAFFSQEVRANFTTHFFLQGQILQNVLRNKSGRGAVS